VLGPLPGEAKPNGQENRVNGSPKDAIRLALSRGGQAPTIEMARG
jgi:hypothetical protein